MWKSNKEEPSSAAAPKPFAPAATIKEAPAVATKPFEPFRAEVAHIGKSVLIKGELSGSEDLYFDGEVEGSIDLSGHSLTVGPNGRLRAQVRANEIVVHGKVDGNLVGAERVELKRSAVMVGDIVTKRVIVEDGAFFKGKIEIQREAAKETARPETPQVARGEAARVEAPRAVAAGANPGSSTAVASGSQASFLDGKR